MTLSSFLRLMSLSMLCLSLSLWSCQGTIHEEAPPEQVLAEGTPDSIEVFQPRDGGDGIDGDKVIDIDGGEVSPDASGPLFSPKVELLVPWTSERQKQEPFFPSYFAKFEAKGRHLLYLAAAHSTDKNSETFRLVAEAIDKYPAQLMILEGFETARGVSPSFYIDYANRCWGGPTPQPGCGEPPYAAYLGQKKKLPFIGGEPTDVDIYKAMQKKGYKLKDMVSFYLLRQILNWQRENLSDIEFEKRVASYIQHCAKDRFKEPSGVFSSDDFKSWYREKMGKAFDRKLHTRGDVSPDARTTANYTQRMSFLIGQVRDISIVHLIAKALNKNERVLIIYGGGHLVSQRKVLEDMLGKAKWHGKSYKGK